MTGREEKAYRVQATEDGRWALVDAAGVTIMAARDERNVQHYAELLNRAWSDGFRRGFRAARRADPEPD